MNAITCAIVDDEPIARNLLRGYIEKDERLSLVAECASINQMLDSNRKVTPQLLFLDIQMPRISGLEYIRSVQNAPAVIFTTAYREYALDAFNLNAVDYLAKPFSFERFLQAVHKAETFLRNRSGDDEPDYLYVKADGKLVKVTIDEILYIEALKEYVKIVMAHGKAVVTYMSMHAMEEHLPRERFHRVHRSYIVNLSGIEVLDGSIVIIGSREIPVSRNEKEKLTALLNARKVGR